MDKADAIILGGKVYLADPQHVNCSVNCALVDYCCKIEGEYEHPLCVILEATEADDFGFRFSQELTDKITNKKK